MTLGFTRPKQSQSKIAHEFKAIQEGTSCVGPALINEPL
jgi:hypothetical protein